MRHVIIWAYIKPDPPSRVLPALVGRRALPRGADGSRIAGIAFKADRLRQTGITAMPGETERDR